MNDPINSQSEAEGRAGYNFDSIVAQADHLIEIQKVDVQPGDRLFVRTMNSLYSIHFVDHQRCVVSGGWFDRKGLSPMTTTITGCSWGGSSIKVDIVAACGLCLEFNNRLITTAIQKIIYFPRAALN